ncbi:hypothetical protein FTX61_00675 [Nitriliruptoraceae bacterium ZYF776]|nr:hypothetical protein [Profundirhabdus halotolerans]
MTATTGTTGDFRGADVGRLAKVVREFERAAAKVQQTITYLRALIIALKAASFFTGGASRAYAAYLETTVLPWLQKTLMALRSATAVLSRQIGDQERASSLATLGIDTSAYRTPTLPTTSTWDAPRLELPGLGGGDGAGAGAGGLAGGQGLGVGAVSTPAGVAATPGLDGFAGPDLSAPAPGPGGSFAPAPALGGIGPVAGAGSLGDGGHLGGVGGGHLGVPAPIASGAAGGPLGSAGPDVGGAGGWGATAGSANPGSLGGGSAGPLDAGGASGGGPGALAGAGSDVLGGDGGLGDGDPVVTARGSVTPSGDGSFAARATGLGGDVAAEAPAAPLGGADGAGAATYAGAGLGVLGAGALGLAKGRLPLSAVGDVLAGDGPEGAEGLDVADLDPPGGERP